MGMDQYLLIPFLGGWTSIYQLFWCSPGVQGFDTLPNETQQTSDAHRSEMIQGTTSSLWWHEMLRYRMATRSQKGWIWLNHAESTLARRQAAPAPWHCLQFSSEILSLLAAVMFWSRFTFNFSVRTSNKIRKVVSSRLVNQEATMKTVQTMQEVASQAHIIYIYINYIYIYYIYIYIYIIYIILYYIILSYLILYYIYILIMYIY